MTWRARTPPSRTSAEHARALGGNLAADLLAHLPVPTAEVTRGHRALWMLTADGVFGADAREHLPLSTVRHWSREGVAVPASAALRAPGMREDGGGARSGPAVRAPRTS
ncbi:hypothetical protein [Nocardiopsis sp. FIRDI 009]|uniref:hypothetical protein n=1 Tax=Nocardiopsis sp. FIRDI 009 TaxID=714197 RepID=UPI000E275900|nr:hypothetical protein [Nocardiopsis sp. FIRDI 009]